MEDQKHPEQHENQAPIQQSAGFNPENGPGTGPKKRPRLRLSANTPAISSTQFNSNESEDQDFATGLQEEDLPLGLQMEEEQLEQNDTAHYFEDPYFEAEASDEGHFSHSGIDRDLNGQDEDNELEAIDPEAEGDEFFDPFGDEFEGLGEEDTRDLF